jgi:hypothetical protein
MKELILLYHYVESPAANTAIVWCKCLNVTNTPAGMSEIAISEKIIGTGSTSTRLNGNSIGLENTLDYCSRTVNEIHQYFSQQT